MSDWTEIRKDFPVLERFRYFYTASGVLSLGPYTTE